MELQQNFSQFQAQGIKLFAVSYDPVETLAAFSNLHGIQYPLLSDRGSEVIKRFGILNTLVKPEETEHYGIPYPGSYLAGEDGRVAAKYFHREYQVREAGPTALRSGFHVPVDPSSFAHAESSEDGVDVAVELAAKELRFMQRVDLYVTFSLAQGLHVYGPSAPDGYIATEVTVSGPEGLRVGQAEFPPTKPFRVEGLPEVFQVLEGRPVVRVPLVIGVRGVPSVALKATVRYQACDDRQCFLPKTKEFPMDLPVGQMVRGQ